MSQNWAEILLFICCRRAVLLPDGVGDVGVPDAVRVLARPRRSGAPALAQVAHNRVPQRRAAIGVALAAALMIPTLWNYFVGYLVGTAIAVIGLYIAFILPVILRFGCRRRVRARRLEPRAALQVDRPDRDRLGRASSASSSCCRLTRSGFPWEDGFTWEAGTTRRSVGGAIVLFGGWWLISAKKWFKGPVRMGTEEELERSSSASRTRPGCIRSLRPRTSTRGGAPRRPSTSSGPGAAVLIDRLAGDAARVGREQPGDRARDVLRLAHPAERYVPHRVGEAPPRASCPSRRRSPPALPRHFGLDPAGADRVHLDVSPGRARRRTSGRARAGRPWTRSSRCSRAPRSGRVSMRSRRRGEAQARRRDGEGPRGRAVAAGEIRRDEVVEAVAGAVGVRPAEPAVGDEGVDRAAGGRSRERRVDPGPVADIAAVRTSADRVATSRAVQVGASSESDAPSAARRSAIAFPIPCRPPVTTIVCPRVCASLSFFRSLRELYRPVSCGPRVRA